MRPRIDHDHGEEEQHSGHHHEEHALAPSIFSACVSGNVKRVQELVGRGTKVDIQDDSGYSVRQN